ncbi:hypothetical protein EAX61_09405 [Dokdonia sinensis]|uniref:Uncharacterized protein n=1 Tax=Dokdonia sinensis TaxID=2479847 RepID=A0A3M0G7Y7_9FLAO|nr:hypothetical protein [Dokdonia sinensis]RMB58512.1 hypothetical protein EAX61_09405 [Dokdonia sinensis]
MPPIKSSLFMIGLLLVSNIALCQNSKIDSLRLLLKENHPPKRQVNIYATISEEFYDSQVYYDSSYFYNEKAMTLAKEHNITKEIARSYFNFGMIQDVLGDYGGALENYLEAQSLFYILDDPVNLSVVNSSIAAMYFNKKQYNEAIDYYQKAIKISIAQNDTIGMIIDYLNVGESEYKLDKYLDSKVHLEYALELMKEKGVQFSAGNIYYGNTLLALDSITAAEKQGKLGLKGAQEEKNIKNISEASELLYKINVVRENYALAINHYERFVVYKDSLNAARELNNKEKLKLNFDLSRKEKELTYLSEKAKYLNIIYILVGVGFVLIIFLISRQLKMMRMTKNMHDIQTRLVTKELEERELRKKASTSISSFRMTRAQDKEMT